jgi:Tfp pilus assembly protein PilO
MVFAKFEKFNLKNKITVSLVGFIIVFFCLICFIVTPTIKDIKSMSEQIEAQKIDLEKKYIRGHGLKQLAENLKKVQPQLSLLDQIFINKNRELEFITALENKANASRISQKISLSAPEATESQQFQKSNLRLYIQGKFDKQLEYLLNLESLNYYVNIKSLEFAPTSDVGANSQENQLPQNQGNNINMFISAETYWK